MSTIHHPGGATRRLVAAARAIARARSPAALSGARPSASPAGPTRPSGLPIAFWATAISRSGASLSTATRTSRVTGSGRVRTTLMSSLTAVTSSIAYLPARPPIRTYDSSSPGGADRTDFGGRDGHLVRRAHRSGTRPLSRRGLSGPFLRPLDKDRPPGPPGRGRPARRRSTPLRQIRIGGGGSAGG